MIQNAPAAWQTAYETGLVTSRDNRWYMDFRQREYPDVGAGAPTFTPLQDLIDRGNCESTTEPMIYGETVAAGSNVTYARSDTVAYQGTYAGKLTKSIAAGTSGSHLFVDDTSTVNLHGAVPGQTYCLTLRMYLPSGGVQNTEVTMRMRYYDSGAWTTSDTTPVATYDAWQELTGSITLPSSATGFGISLRFESTAALNEFYYIDNVVLGGYVIPGSHFMSGGYSENLMALPSSFVMEVKFRANFAYDTASNQPLWGWYADATSYLEFRYHQLFDQYRLLWRDNGTVRYLLQPTSTYSATNPTEVWTTMALSFDPSGGQTGSALWVNGSSVDVNWGGAPDSISTVFNKFQLRAHNGTAGAFDIAYVRFFSGTTATQADVDNGFADLGDEEVLWSMNGHATGRTRCNVTSHVLGYQTDKSIRDVANGLHSTNTMDLTLQNRTGVFSDDQNAAWDPTVSQYNGTTAQNYLRNRCGVSMEQWVGTDFDTVFWGRLTEGFSRASRSTNSGTVTASAGDGMLDLQLNKARDAKSWSNKSIVDAGTPADSLLHLVAGRGDRKYDQYLADNSFEDATLADSWIASAGVLTQVADPLFGSNCGQLANATGARVQLYQTVNFTIDVSLNVGESWNFSVWLKAAAAASDIINISERDSGGSNAITSTTYTLAGGEGWVRYDVTHVIEDSDSDALRVNIWVEDTETVKFDGAMLIRGKVPVNHFEANAAEGTAGVYNAYDAVEVTYPWFGIVSSDVTYTNVFRRFDANTSVAENLASIADACGALYFGFLECDSLYLTGVAEDAWSEPVQLTEITDKVRRGSVTVTPSARKANRIVGHGVEIKALTAYYRQLWQASRTGHFAEGYGEDEINETVANGDFWPDATTYPEYWCAIEGSRPGSTLAPPTVDIEYRVIPTQITEVRTHGERSNTVTRTVNITYATAQHENVTAANALRAKYHYSYGGTDHWIDALQRGARRKQEIPQGARVIGFRPGVRLLHIYATALGLTPVSRGNLVAGVDITTRADSIRILYENTSGGNVVIKDAGLLGYPVVMSGEGEGWVHDHFADWDDIRENGERLFEFGSNDIVDQTQLKKLAEWYWKVNRGKFHNYAYSSIGERLWFSPGQWYRLNFGSAGTTENIDSVVECYRVVTQGAPRTLGTTMLHFREIEQNMKFDSSAVARYVASGSPFMTTPQTNSVIVASSTYIGDAQYRCDGTADEVQINQAIDFVSETYGGGTVRLTRGTFIIAASVALKSGVTMTGEGTTIEKNCDDYAISAIGGAGTELAGISVRDITITRNAADTNAKSFVYFYYTDDFWITGVDCTGSYTRGMQFTYCDRGLVQDCTITDWRLGTGIELVGGNTDFVIRDCVLDNLSTNRIGTSGIGGICTGATVTGSTVRNLTADSNDVIGINLFGSDMKISDCHVENLDCNDLTGIYSAIGILMQADYGKAIGNVIIDVDNGGSAAGAAGIQVTADNCIVDGNSVRDGNDEGIEITGTADRTNATGNTSLNNTTSNYTNNGTNTSATGNIIA